MCAENDAEKLELAGSATAENYAAEAQNRVMTIHAQIHVEIKRTWTCVVSEMPPVYFVGDAPGLYPHKYLPPPPSNMPIVAAPRAMENSVTY